jgi:hypothetical protein
MSATYHCGAIHGPNSVQSNHGLWIHSTEGGGGKNVFVHVSAVEFY